MTPEDAIKTIRNGSVKMSIQTMMGMIDEFVQKKDPNIDDLSALIFSFMAVHSELISALADRVNALAERLKHVENGTQP